MLGIGGAKIGENNAQTKQEEYLQSQIVQIEGNSNNVTFNDVDDLVSEYNNLLNENESLEAKNTSYFNDLTVAKEEVQSLKSQMGDIPQISYNSLGLMLDAQDISINKNNSMVTIDGKDYFAREITEKLLPDGKNLTIKDGNIFVGTVVTDKANLTNQWIVNESDCKTDFSGNDSYGNPRTNSIIFSYYTGEIEFNLNRKYSYLKCTISACEDCPMNSNITLTVNPDTGNSYTVQITKTTEPFEVEIPINNCSLLTITCDSSHPQNSVIISNAIVYN